MILLLVFYLFRMVLLLVFGFYYSLLQVSLKKDLLYEVRMGRWRYKILLKFYETGVAENNQFQGNSARLFPCSWYSYSTRVGAEKFLFCHFIKKNRGISFGRTPLKIFLLKSIRKIVLIIYKYKNIIHYDPLWSTMSPYDPKYSHHEPL